MKNDKIYGVGFLGEESHIRSNQKCYDMWRGMLRRCYDEKSWLKEPSYKECSVCEEWYNYTNFKKWYEENYYEIPNERMCLDKDILVKNNKIYSPITCCICPARINSIFKNTKKNKYGFVGININKHIGKNGNIYISYVSRVNSGTKRISKYFKTKEKAFKDYKIRKEQEIKQVADEYKNIIPKKVYDAIYNYKIEIND